MTGIRTKTGTRSQKRMASFDLAEFFTSINRFCLRSPPALNPFFPFFERGHIPFGQQSR